MCASAILHKIETCIKSNSSIINTPTQIQLTSYGDFIERVNIKHDTISN